MLAFRLCRIVATLFHRALFLLLADFLAGHRWFFINSFTAAIDAFFSANYDYLLTLTDPTTFMAGVGRADLFWLVNSPQSTSIGCFVGFCLCWWMVHFLGTREMWFNGVMIELFLLVQLLGHLSNVAFTTSNKLYPVVIGFFIYCLVDVYRFYIQELRTQDPEQIFYRLPQLKKPFVPKRALQVIQITPVIYTVLHLSRNRFDDANYFRIKYSLGMADALVFVGINLDFGLALLTRISGTIRHIHSQYSWKNIGYFCRFNITGSYNIQVRDIGWSAIPGDQVQLAWILYWGIKVLLISVFWTQTPNEGYLRFLAIELSSNFVAATATVYLLCLLTGFLLASVATVFTSTSDVMACSSVCLGSYDTVQHIRWLSLTSLLCPHNRMNLVFHVLFAHLPLCGHMIQNIGEAVRRRCGCNAQSWLSAFGGILSIILYMLYSVAVYRYLSFGPPNVSHCFAYVMDMTKTVWLFHNCLMTLVELVTIVVYQVNPIYRIYFLFNSFRLCSGRLSDSFF